MKTKIVLLSVCLIFACTSTVQAQFGGLSKTGLSAATFLSIEVGPRAKSMGGAFVGVADDISTLYWNPSGLVNLDGKHVYVAHTEWLADVNHDFIGIAVPVSGVGVIGASLTSVNVPEMKVRTVLQPEGTGEVFDATDIALAVSFARKLTNRFAFGTNFKYIRENIMNSTASTVAVDLGLLFKSDFRNLGFGVSISNFGGDMTLGGTDTEIEVDVAPDQFGNNDRILANLTTEDFQLPLTLRVGLAMDVLTGNSATARIAVDGVVPNDNKQYVNVGAEVLVVKTVALRAGYRTLFLADSEEGLTLGAGVQTKLGGEAKVGIDYAYTHFGVLDIVHEFALTIAF